MQCVPQRRGSQFPGCTGTGFLTRPACVQIKGADGRPPHATGRTSDSSRGSHAGPDTGPATRRATGGRGAGPQDTQAPPRALGDSRLLTKRKNLWSNQTSKHKTQDPCTRGPALVTCARAGALTIAWTGNQDAGSPELGEERAVRDPHRHSGSGMV